MSAQHCDDGTVHVLLDTLYKLQLEGFLSLYLL